MGNSLALREFVAYEGDARIAFVKKATEGARIDKVSTHRSVNIDQTDGHKGKHQNGLMEPMYN